jgi:hypothetical protein
MSNDNRTNRELALELLNRHRATLLTHPDPLAYHSVMVKEIEDFQTAKHDDNLKRLSALADEIGQPELKARFEKNAEHRKNGTFEPRPCPSKGTAIDVGLEFHDRVCTILDMVCLGHEGPKDNRASSREIRYAAETLNEHIAKLLEANAQEAS